MKNSVDKSSPLPRYIQARRYLEDLIRERGLGPGDQLPPERDLSSSFEVSQMTMNRAIQEMVREGLLYREVGRGTYVARQDSTAHFGILGMVALGTPSEVKSDPYGGEILRGVRHAALDTNWDLLLIQGPLFHPDEIAARLRGRADGFLIMSAPDAALPGLRQLRSAGVPFLSVGSSWPDEDIPAVDSDNTMGARLVAEHLVSLGHRNIGLVAALPFMSNSRDRVKGFTAALNENGIPLPDERFIMCSQGYDVTPEECERAVKMAKTNPKVTAIFAGGYMLATRIIEALQTAGLRVPEDVSVVAFDDKLSAAFLTPPLTTVAQPLEAMGKRAVVRLEAAIRGEKPLDGIELLPTQFVKRQSTAPPPAH